MAESQDIGVAAPPAALVQALHRLLRPLVRLLLRYQITYPYLANLLKRVYVDVAEREFAIEGRPQTTSRVSLLTGIHRKDVRRLRAEPAPDQSTPPVVSLGAQLVARWTASPEFQDAEGHPLALPKQAARGPSFDGLVASVSKDIRSRAVLDEWLRLGVVRLAAEDRVELVAEAFVPESGFDEKAFYFGRNVGDHLASAAHNLSGAAGPMLERSVYYDELSEASVEELAALSEELGMAALQAVNRRAMALQQRDAGASDASRRINFGIYFLRENQAAAAEGEEEP